jgi:hypothetical protein
MNDKPSFNETDDPWTKSLGAGDGLSPTSKELRTG